MELQQSSTPPLPLPPPLQDRPKNQEVHPATPPSDAACSTPVPAPAPVTAPMAHTHPPKPPHSAPPAAPTVGPGSDRPLNVSDALGYLDEVKNRFQDRPDVYNQFLDIMKDFKSQVLTTPGVIERVSTLFSGHPELISGFNTFLPPGYRIECSSGSKQLITVTTPSGTLTQNAAGSLTMQHARPAPPPTRVTETPRVQETNGEIRRPEPEGRPAAEPPKREVATPLLGSSKPPTPRPLRSHPPTPQPQIQMPQSQIPQSQPLLQPQLPPPSPQPQMQPVQPQPPPAGSVHPAQVSLPSQNPPVTVTLPGFGNSLVLTPAVALNSSQTTASAASVLGGMHRMASNPEPTQPTHPPAAFHPSLPQVQPLPMASPVPLATPGPLPGPGLQPQPQPEFYHAIQYINRIKTRFADEPETYKQFLEILQTYQKEQRLLHDVYAQVTQLFRGAPDLIDEFKMFLPDTSANAGVTPGVLPPSTFVGQPMVGPGGTVGVMGMLGQTGTPGPATGQTANTSQSGATEWTMEVQSVNAKGDKATSYRRKVAGSDQNREGPPVKKRRKAPEKESRAEKDKERDRERESMQGLNMKVVPRKPKHSAKAPEPLSPTFTQYGQPPSPANGSHVLTHPAMHPHPSLPPLPQVPLPPPPPPPPRLPTPPASSAAPEVFFDRVKRALDDRDAWEEFLKLLTLFSSEIIEETMLLQMVAPFLGGQGSELELQFRDILGIDRVRKDSLGEMPKAVGHTHGYGYPTGMGSTYLTGPKFRYGPSYRRLPESATCSGRDELGRSVLNDDWVSHPTWASEESGFVAHKKNTFEEALHKSEEERHEYHVHLESMAHTISLLEPISFKIGDMSPEERATFRLSPDLGGRSKSIHQKIIKRVYGRENAQEVLQSLQDNPSVAVPVVLFRLKQVDAEWRKNKREWEKVWREVDARNFYKSLDHQGVGFKANDKKAITGKALLAEIERIKEDQDKKRAEDGEIALERNTGGSRERSRRSQVLPRYQLEYDMRDEAVLQDALKLTLCYLERSDQRQSASNALQYNAVERRRIEAFLRHYVMHQFGFGPDFDGVFGPPIDQAEWEDLGLYIADGDEDSMEEEDARKGRKSGKKSGGSGPGGAVSAGDLKKKLNKTRKAMERSYTRKTRGTSKANSNSNSSYHRSRSSSRHASPVPRGSDAVSPTRASYSENEKSLKDKGKGREVDLDDIWLRHVEVDIADQNSKNAAGPDAMDHNHGSRTNGVQSPKFKRLGSFFCNTPFYTLIRLLQLLYSRLMVCKSLAAKLAAEGSTSFLPNSVALDLGLMDTAGPMAYFANLALSTSQRALVKALAATLMLPLSGRDNPSSPNPAEHFYLHLLDLVEKVFDGELEQTTFEENMRFMFGTRAFVVFTLDKLCGAICKQVQAVLQEGRCHELMNMLEQQRARDAAADAESDVAVQDIIRYRRQAEELVGSDENLFRVDWLTDSKCLRIQLLDIDDLSVDPPSPTARESRPPARPFPGPEALSPRITVRWKQYVQSYVLRYPTEGRRIGVGRKIFLKKTLLDEDADELADSRWITDAHSERGLEVMVGPGTCKLYYASGCEEASWRVRLDAGRVSIGNGEEGGEEVGAGAAEAGKRGERKMRRNSSDDEQDAEDEEEMNEWERLRERAEARSRERKRWISQFNQGLLF